MASGCLRASTYLHRSEVTASQTTADIIRGSSSGIIFHLFFPIIFMLVCISQHDMPIDTFLKDHFRYKHKEVTASQTTAGVIRGSSGGIIMLVGISRYDMK